MLDEATDAYVATMPSFAGVADSRTRAESVLQPAESIISAMDLAALASMQNTKYGGNGFSVLDAFTNQPSQQTRQQTDNVVLADVGESKTSSLTANVHQEAIRRFTDPNFRNRNITA